MALYLVVHHQRDTDRPYANSWLDDDRLQAITTTDQVGRLCEAAQRAEERVFVHRCRCGSEPAVICCSVQVARVSQLPERGCLVEFSEPAALACPPPVRPGRGQIIYEAEPVQAG